MATIKREERERKVKQNHHCDNNECADLLSDKEIQPLLVEAEKYADFKEFSDDFSLHILHGRYWHITNCKDFSIEKKCPYDVGVGPTTIGLFVTTYPESWQPSFPTRQWVAEIDLSHAIKNKDFFIGSYGDNEFFIRNLDKVKVVQVLPIEEAIKQSEEYHEHLPQSREDLKILWDCIHKKETQKK